MICIRSNTLVEVLNENGNVIAKAFRADTKSKWFIGTSDEEGRSMKPLAVVHSFVPEVLGRKLVIAMLKEFVVENEEF